MKIGVVLPQTEIGNDPGAIKAYAEAVEEMGFTHILVFDHVLGANPERPGGWKGPYTYRHAFHEPFVLFGFLAAATRRVGLVSGIIILPQRQTALVAKQAAAVDVLSGGRLRLGVGVGWNPVEFEALGEDFHTRGRRIEEQIEVNDTRGVIWYHHTSQEFADMITDQFDEMLAQSARQPLVCPISLHPFVFGRPYRIRRLRRALQHILGHGDRVWITRPRDICAHIESLPAGVVPGSR